VGSEAGGLTLAFARSATATEASTNDCALSFRDGALSLRGLRDIVEQEDLGPLPLAPCQAGAVLLGERLSSSAVLLKGAQQARKAHETGIGLVLAAALSEILGHEKSEEDPADRDALLDELRALAANYANDAAMRE